MQKVLTKLFELIWPWIVCLLAFAIIGHLTWAIEHTGHYWHEIARLFQ